MTDSSMYDNPGEDLTSLYYGLGAALVSLVGCVGTIALCWCCRRFRPSGPEATPLLDDGQGASSPASHDGGTAEHRRMTV